MFINRTTVIGRVGRDATVRHFDNGTVAINFSVCNSNKFNDLSGALVEKKTWYECTIWRKRDQSTEFHKYFAKGKQVYLEGEVDASLYEDRSGQAKAVLTLRVNVHTFLGDKEEAA